MQLITHPSHIDRLPQTDLKTHIQNRFRQLSAETDIPPIIILVEPHDDITGPDFAFIGDRGLLTDLWESHEPGHPEFVRTFEWVSYLPSLKLYELLFLVCGEDGYWILIPDAVVESHPDLEWLLTSQEAGGLSEPQPLY